MPVILWALVAALGVQVVVDVASLADGWGRMSQLELVIPLLALVLDATLIGLLLHGSEATRTLLRMAAGIGVAIDGALVVATLAWAPMSLAGVLALVTAMAMLGCSVFAYWVLGHEAVTTWMFQRWLARVPGGDDAPVSP